ncbi:MAG: amino acid ABC transporter substrate-binding protein [Desulfobacteraceae bacterium]|nr:amino acid ABC transporter substrate-binding protein [Desulfobacteraceae bacterium]MCB9494174.1 amino acid ABC transporter substrate-binding protein [Desulfobacteraceae bacterium]
MKFKLSALLASLFLVFSFSVSARDLNTVCDIWPPYQIKDGGNLTGYSVELVRAVSGKMSVQNLSIKDYPWKRALHMVTTGEVDALFSANYSKEREEFAFYPKEPLIVSPWVVWVKEGSGIDFKTFDDLAGLNCGVVRGYSYTPEFWDFLKTKGRFSEVADDETNFKKLNVDRVDYTVSELGNGYQIINKLGIKGLVPILHTPIKEDGLYIMFNKDRISQDFVDEFSKALEDFKKTMEFQQLYNNYFK